MTAYTRQIQRPEKKMAFVYRKIVNSFSGRARLAFGGLIRSTWVTEGATSVALISR